MILLWRQYQPVKGIIQAYTDTDLCSLHAGQCIVSLEKVLDDDIHLLL